MKETREYTHVSVNVLTDDGAHIPLKATEEKVTTFYSIKGLTTRCNMIDLLTIMSNVCKSSKDISTVNSLLDMADGNNAIRFDSVTKLAAYLGMPRTSLSTMFTNLVKEGLLKKVSAKDYRVNPFIFTGKRVRSNEVRESLQFEWKKL